MKRVIWLLCFVLLLGGCTSGDDSMDKVLTLRSKLLAQGAELDGVIVADFSDRTYTFCVHCVVDVQGKVTFQVTEPSSIAGITGTVSAGGGKLTFDDQALAFPNLADGQLSPVSAPWVLMNTLRSGYLTSAGMESGVVRVAIDDSYADNALHLDIWLDENELPARCEIIWKGRRVLSMEVKNFRLV